MWRRSAATPVPVPMAQPLLQASRMSPPSEALLLAAGMGTRLAARTRSRPKPLVRVNGVPIALNAVAMLAAAGVAQTTVVIGYCGDQLRAAIGHAVGAMRLRYEVNEHYASTGTARSLSVGLQGLHGDVLVLEGDVFFERSVLEHFLCEPYSDATLVERWHEALDGSVVQVGTDACVERWVHKSQRPAGFRLEGTHKTVNLHRFSAGFVRECLRPALSSAAARATDAIEMSLARIVAGGARIRATEVRGRWVEIDDEHDLRRAETVFNGAADGPR